MKMKFNKEYCETAIFYDLDIKNRKFNDELFYKNLLESYNCKKILELGCGTGRVSIALSKFGFNNITSLDISKEMLAIFNTKNTSNTINIIQGDMANFSLNEKFDCIVVPFRSFQCLVDNKDISGFFQSVRKHLSENGILILNIFIPLENMDKLKNNIEEREFKLEKIKYKKTTINEKIDTENQTLTYSIEYNLNDIGSNKISERFNIKYYYPEQLINLIKLNNFLLIKEFIGFEKNNKIDNSDYTIVCKKHKA